jgi:hypothetical protein
MFENSLHTLQKIHSVCITNSAIQENNHLQHWEKYAPETWVLSISDETALAIFERKVLRSIYGPVKDNNEWRIRYSYELYALYEYMNIITFIKVGRLKWAGHVVRMDQKRPL